MIGDIENGVCPVHGLIGGTDKHLGFDHERKTHICLTCIRDEIGRLRKGIYDHACRIPREQAEQIDPVQYLKTRTVHVEDHNASVRELEAEAEAIDNCYSDCGECRTCLRERARRLEMALNEGQPCSICNHVERAEKLEKENARLRGSILKDDETVESAVDLCIQSERAFFDRRAKRQQREKAELEAENKALRNLLMKRYRMSDLEVNILMLDYAEDSK